MQDGHMYEVGGDCVNIHFAMPAESTGWFGISVLVILLNEAFRAHCNTITGETEGA